MAEAKRDQNFVTTLLGVSNVDAITPVVIYADPVTHRLLVDNGGSGGSGITSINGDTTAAQTLTVGTAGTDFNISDDLAGGHVFNLPTASASNRGALSTADWTTFNGKQASGNYITALTGDVTASGPGSVAATLATVNSNVGSFTSANITVDAKGRITAASNGSGGSGSPGGSDTQVQFNDAGSFGGASAFTYDKTDLSISYNGGSTGSFGILTNTGATALLVDTGGDITIGGATVNVSADFMNLDASNSVKLNSGGSFSAVFHTSFLAADRDFAFPDFSGTITALGNSVTGTGDFVLAAGATLTTATVNGVTLNAAGSADTYLTATGSYSTLGTGVATFLATPSSANLAAALTDETGTGVAVFNEKPTFVGTINTVVIMSAQAIDGALGSIFTRTLGGSETFTQSNISTGQCIMVEVTSSGGGADTITWFSGITWVTAGGVAPTQAVAGSAITTYGFRCTASNTFLGYVVGTQ